MKTKKFIYLFNLLNYQLHEKKTIVKELNEFFILENKNLIFELIEGFSNELDFNILNKTDSENKNIVIRYYLNKLKYLEYFFNDYKKVFFENHKINKLNDFENYVKNCFYVYDLLMFEIQNCCINNNIDFMILCNSINLDVSIFDTGLTMFANENKIKKTETPKHENIFSNNGFILFEHILKEYVKPKKGRQSDLIFYHRKMYDNKPQYIHQKPTEFFNWFEKNYTEVFGQLKTLSQVETIQRNKDFSNALDWFKLQNY